MPNLVWTQSPREHDPPSNIFTTPKSTPTRPSSRCGCPRLTSPRRGQQWPWRSTEAVRVHRRVIRRGRWAWWRAWRWTRWRAGPSSRTAVVHRSAMPDRSVRRHSLWTGRWAVRSTWLLWVRARRRRLIALQVWHGWHVTCWGNRGAGRQPRDGGQCYRLVQGRIGVCWCLGFPWVVVIAVSALACRAPLAVFVPACPLPAASVVLSVVASAFLVTTPVSFWTMEP